MSGQVQPFMVMDVMRKANRLEATGRDVLREVGPVDWRPSGVIAAAQQALVNDRLGYTEALGIDPLRRQSQNITATPTTSCGGGPGDSHNWIIWRVHATFLSAFDVGDRVVLVDPGYPAYRNILAALGIEAVCVPATAEDRYQPTPALLDHIDGDIDGLIVASPANPTGTMITGAEMVALTTYCDDRGIRLISDEIYHHLRNARRLRYLAANAFIVNSFSKYYSMTKWRVGWMVIPEQLHRSVECLTQNIFISVPTLSQHAASAAFDCTAELDENVARYAANRDLLLRELPCGADKPCPGRRCLLRVCGCVASDER